MMAGILVLAIIGLGVINAYLYYTIKYNTKENSIFKVLSENASHGTILLLNGIKEENTTLLFLIKNADQLSEFKEVCEMVGKCKYYGKNEKRRRFAMSCKL